MGVVSGCGFCPLTSSEKVGAYAEGCDVWDLYGSVDIWAMQNS